MNCPVCDHEVYALIASGDVLACLSCLESEDRKQLLVDCQNCFSPGTVRVSPKGTWGCSACGCLGHALLLVGALPGHLDHRLNCLN